MMSRATLLLFILYFLSSQSKGADRIGVKHYYKSIRCRSFDPKTIQFEFCRVRKDKNWVYFDFGFGVLKTLNKPIYMQLSIARKTKQNYFQDYFRTEQIEVSFTILVLN